ncbi:hypothetical protein [Micromonospora arborensis]|uniref:hypothetical protein n=1 Tax=Micromonospora arborensis TaxID=2116518 RepID=UPI003710C08E
MHSDQLTGQPPNGTVLALTALPSEPGCCGTPMVRNSFTGQYECADAYFQLLDDGVLGGVPDLSDTDAMNDHQRDRYEHWKTTRIDGQLATP